MHIVVLAVGRLRPYYRDAANDYLRRLRRYATVEEREVREPRAPGADVARAREAAALRERMPPGGTVVALARQGTRWSSEALARRVAGWQERARPLVLVLGGSHGLAPDLLAGADERWSLGPLTLPHELARVIALEQVYRAFTILRGEPYHKGR
ncbi:MAG TPA: 23S rRNA (pseudouridine(1915)-N(3))-methyltransferase RlmH [Gemmatimonadales bacterium]|nr:23S rRNA (pseudouridine(1915)-N(3))-methyltransferase RlmH [Gemmatimonadales bacterium]